MAWIISGISASPGADSSDLEVEVNFAFGFFVLVLPIWIVGSLCCLIALIWQPRTWAVLGLLIVVVTLGAGVLRNNLKTSPATSAVQAAPDPLAREGNDFSKTNSLNILICRPHSE